MKVKSVWPGGWVEVPEFNLPGDPLIIREAQGKPLKKIAQMTRPEGLAAVILGLAARRSAGPSWGQD